MVRFIFAGKTIIYFDKTAIDENFSAKKRVRTCWRDFSLVNATKRVIYASSSHYQKWAFGIPNIPRQKDGSWLWLIYSISDREKWTDALWFLERCILHGTMQAFIKLGFWNIFSQKWKFSIWRHIPHSLTQ